MNKKKIMWISESSFTLHSGFSTLTKEILLRLHKTGKYDISEICSYAQEGDSRLLEAPWKTYGAIPHQSQQLETQRYNSSVYGQFGEAMLETALLKEKPDILIDVRDNWHCEFELRSPFREFYKLMWMICTDSEPCRPEWSVDHSLLDGALNYEEYGKYVLDRYSPNIKSLGLVRPGVNTDIFKPLNNKKELRNKLGIPQNAKVILKTARNQRRKLFPDLIEAFQQYIKHCIENGNKELADQTYLHIHSSFPDVGFPFDRLTLQSGLSHRILFTYVCNNCRNCFVDFFQTEITPCKHCGSLAATMPNTQFGVTREQLAEIYNCADLYIQYSIAGALEMPICEAKSCGIVPMATDYAAMRYQVLPEHRIKISKFFLEPETETGQSRCLPDTEDCVKKIYKFFTSPESLRAKMAENARKDAVENYSFDRAAKIMEDVIDQMSILDRSKTWDNHEPKFINTNIQPPQFRSNGEFVDWCIGNFATVDKFRTSFYRNTLIKGLNTGFLIQGAGGAGRQQFNREICYKQFIDRANEYNWWHKMRVKEFEKDDKSVMWEKL